MDATLERAGQPGGLWFSPRSQLLARDTPEGLELSRWGAPLANLTGVMAEEFLQAFLSPTDSGSMPRLELTARLGIAAHAELLSLARQGGGVAWIPGMAITRSSQLFLEVTGRCNERCQHCYASAGPDVGTALTREECLRVIVQGRAAGFECLQLTGGDPLLCTFLPVLARAARTAGYPFLEIYTNGLALSESRLMALAPHAPDFAFSIYSHDAAIHDGVTRVPGSLERTCAAVRRVLAAGLKARVGIVALEASAPTLALTRAMVEALGVPAEAIAVDIPRQVGRGDGLSVPELAEHEVRPAHGGPSPSTRREPTLSWPGKLAVAYTGDVMPCIFARQVILGNVREEGLGEILERLRARRARSWADPGRHTEKLACVDCRYTAAIWEAGE
jgi:radical SAM protein with 4Fe4S-binding SPASM domain